MVLLGAHALIALAIPRWLPRHAEGPEHAARLPTAAVVVLLVVGLGLRLPGLNGGLWFDEIQTLVEYVRQPWGVLLTTFDNSNQHFLFSIAARATTELGGESAAMLRLPAVIFGVFSLWAAVAFGKRWLSTREAWWSGVILAVSYHHVWFSQNARGYTGLLLGTLLGSAIMLDLLRGAPATSRRVWSYALVMALTLLTHVTALVVVAAHGCCWLIQRRRLAPGTARWAPGAALALAGSVTMLLYAPVLPQLIGALGSSGTGVTGAEWQRPGWFLAEAVAGLVRGVPMGVVLVPIAGLIVLAGLIETWRRDALVTLMMTLPLLIMATLVLATGHNMWPRFFFFGAAFIVQWAVHGGVVVLERVLPRVATRLGDAGLAVVAVASLLLLPRAWAPKQDYPAAIRWLAANSAPGDGVVGTEMMELPINDWLEQHWAIARGMPELSAVEAGHRQTWVISSFPIRLESTRPEIARHLATDYEIATVIPASIGGGEITIFRRRIATP